STLAGLPFPKPLVVTVTDSAGNPVSGIPVTFAGPATGAGIGPPPPVPLLTSLNGQVVFPAVANGTPGRHAGTATAGGLTATFSVTNTRLASITATGGTPQATALGSAFPAALEVTLKDSTGRPVPNVPVIFTPPTSGPSVILSSPVSTTNGLGVATVTATANG